jgi:hypothetical protein
MMKHIGRETVSKRVVTYEISAFLITIAIIWLDEILDIPSLLWGAPRTPINWSESLFESVAIVILAALIIHITLKLFNKMNTLEGLLPICAGCKRIKDDQGAWKQIETYVRDRSEAEFSHGICPECARKLYPDIDLYKK